MKRIISKIEYLLSIGKIVFMAGGGGGRKKKSFGTGAR